MSKKENKKNKKGGNDKKIDYEEAHKAVIIGETFNNILNPLTSDTPCLLLPLCGIPVIEFMLDSLSSSNIIKEIIICIKNNKDIVDKYLKRYHKNLNYKLVYIEEYLRLKKILLQIFPP